MTLLCSSLGTVVFNFDPDLLMPSLEKTKHPRPIVFQFASITFQARNLLHLANLLRHLVTPPGSSILYLFCIFLTYIPNLYRLSDTPSGLDSAQDLAVTFPKLQFFLKTLSSFTSLTQEELRISISHFRGVMRLSATAFSKTDEELAAANAFNKLCVFNFYMGDSWKSQL